MSIDRRNWAQQQKKPVRTEDMVRQIMAPPEQVRSFSPMDRLFGAAQRAQQRQPGVPTPALNNVLSAAPPVAPYRHPSIPAPQPITHTVKPGETLWQIAGQRLPEGPQAWPQIRDQNLEMLRQNIQNTPPESPWRQRQVGDLIHPGQNLQVGQQTPPQQPGVALPMPAPYRPITPSGQLPAGLPPSILPQERLQGADPTVTPYGTGNVPQASNLPPQAQEYMTPVGGVPVDLRNMQPPTLQDYGQRIMESLFPRAVRDKPIDPQATYNFNPQSGDVIVTGDDTQVRVIDRGTGAERGFTGMNLSRYGDIDYVQVEYYSNQLGRDTTAWVPVSELQTRPLEVRMMQQGQPAVEDMTGVQAFVNRVQKAGGETITMAPDTAPKPTTENQMIDSIADTVGMILGYTVQPGAGAQAFQIGAQSALGLAPKVAQRLNLPYAMVEGAIKRAITFGLLGGVRADAAGAPLGETAKQAAVSGLIGGAAGAAEHYAGPMASKVATKLGAPEDTLINRLAQILHSGGTMFATMAGGHGAVEGKPVGEILVDMVASYGTGAFISFATQGIPEIRFSMKGKGFTAHTQPGNDINKVIDQMKRDGWVEIRPGIFEHPNNPPGHHRTLNIIYNGKESTLWELMRKHGGSVPKGTAMAPGQYAPGVPQAAPRVVRGYLPTQGQSVQGPSVAPPVSQPPAQQTVPGTPPAPVEPKGPVTPPAVRPEPTTYEAGKIPEYPVVQKDMVDGRTVRPEIPNQDSISASLSEYTVLPGLRELPMSDFGSDPKQLFYAADDMEQTRTLADAIKQSGEISPLIVVVDKEGPYILEGAHRLGALHLIGAKSFPAMVVVDQNPETGFAETEGQQPGEVRPETGKEIWQMTKGQFVAQEEAKDHDYNMALGFVEDNMNQMSANQMAEALGMTANEVNDLIHELLADDLADRDYYTPEERHRIQVMDAIKKGYDIPDEVKADYPDLFQITGQKPQAPEQPVEPIKPSYGRAGNAAIKRWSINEWVNTDLNKPDSYTHDFVAFFEAYYNAGKEGTPLYQVRLDDDRTRFPAFLEQTFYDAGVKDAASSKPADTTGEREPAREAASGKITIGKVRRVEEKGFEFVYGTMTPEMKETLWGTLTIAQTDKLRDAGITIRKKEEAAPGQKPVETSPEPEYNQGRESAFRKVADFVTDRLYNKAPFSNDELFRAADEAFAGSMAQKTYDVKDAYDAMELGINRYIENFAFKMDAKADRVSTILDFIEENILTVIPTQRNRTTEQNEWQQFSTPPNLAFIAAWAAALTPEDIVIEPSAGVGGLAIFAKGMANHVIVNELSERRAMLLKQLGFSEVYTENAEQLHNILPDTVKPTVVIMNPPFSATAGRMQGQRKTMNATLHLEQALKRLQPGGRLVAIVGKGMSDDAPTFREWWRKIKGEYSVLMNLGIDGKNYKKYGTEFDNQLLIIDKTGPTIQRDGRFTTVTGKVEDLKDAIDFLEVMRDVRTRSDRQAEQGADKPGSQEVAGTGQAAAGPESTSHIPTNQVGPGVRTTGPVGPQSTGQGELEGVHGTPDVQDTAGEGIQLPGERRPGPGGEVGGAGSTTTEQQPTAGGGSAGEIAEGSPGGAQQSPIHGGRPGSTLADRAKAARDRLKDKGYGTQSKMDLPAKKEFQVGDTVYDPGGREYTIVGEGTGNLVRVKNKAGQEHNIGRPALSYHKRDDATYALAERAKGGLPMDDMVDFALIGADMLQQNEGMTYAEWSDAMTKEWGLSVRLFLRGIHGQAEAVLEMSEADLDEFIGMAHGDLDETPEPGPRPDEQQPSPQQKTYKKVKKGQREEMPEPTPQTTDVVMDASAGPVVEGELTDALFSDYKPQKVSIKGAQPHPGDMAQSVALASVNPPNVTYTPNLPAEVITTGKLSLLQLESVVYAGQAHGQKLESGETRGFMIGDGTGVGKGREISGIIMDNIRQGRTKAVWVSKNNDLYSDAIRDWTGIGGDQRQIFSLSSVKTGEPIKKKHGIAFMGYGVLKNGLSLSRADILEAKSDARIDQLAEWLGPDFDGVIAFDECHEMQNAIPVKGVRGKSKPSLNALAGVDLQRRFPKARVVYISATAATDVHNITYADRLGLWGSGTAFANKHEFVSSISSGGIGAMEVIAKDLKAMGLYVARNISFEGVGYDVMEHAITPEQTEVYDGMSEAWQIVLQNLSKALEDTGQIKDGNAKGKANSAFWGALLNFYNQILTSMQMPSVISAVERDLAEGKAVVMQLFNTNEAQLNRSLARMDEDQELDELDITPREALMGYLEKSYPTQQWEEYIDEDGKKRMRPVFDSHGNPVHNADAVRMKNEMLAKVAGLKVPEGVIDQLLLHFGPNVVAEVTGRKQRVVPHADGSGRKTLAKWSDNHAAKDIESFMDDKKQILVFSDKGGTGKSYHADKSRKNQRQRVHYLLQPGWSAHKAVQGFGRTNRTNQASKPFYYLVTTNLKGHKRFISTIARRLDQLGAMTKGQRQTGGGGLFSSADNLENRVARDALAVFYQDLVRGAIEGLEAEEILTKMGLKESLLGEYGQLIDKSDDLRNTTRFLNRLLALDSTIQNKVFEAYEERLSVLTEDARRRGTLDVGMENYKADKANIVHETTVYTDEKTGAETKYTEIEVGHKNEIMTFEEAKEQSTHGFFKNEKSGRVYAVREGGRRTNRWGEVKQTYRLIGQTKHLTNIVDKELITEDGVQKFEGTYTVQIAEDEAMRLWDELTKEVPEYKMQSIHMITGVLLPIWDRLPDTEVKIYRLKLDNGQIILGRLIEDNMLDQTLRRLGADKRAQAQHTPKELYDLIMNQGHTAYLYNGWRIARRRVSGENRMELMGGNLYHHRQALERLGMFTEVISYQARWFIPTGEAGMKALMDLATKLDRVESPKADDEETLSLTTRVESILKKRITETELGKGHSPQKTSLKQVAAGLRRGVDHKILKPGTVNLDIGGGRFDEGTDFLAKKGIENHIYDPYARTKEHNDTAISKDVDSFTLNNVLNVIPSAEERKDVIAFAYKKIPPGGIGVITVYEGDGSGTGKQREFADGTSTWQENRKLDDYRQEIAIALPEEAKLSKQFGMFVVRKPGTRMEGTDDDTLAKMEPSKKSEYKEQSAGEAKGMGKNIGYHAGDLGKAEYLETMSGTRDTGHFGTGVYFVGDKSVYENKHSAHKDRPVHEVDFTDYNLYKPKNAAEAQELHDLLFQINRYAYGHEVAYDSKGEDTYKKVDIEDLYRLQKKLFPGIKGIDSTLNELKSYVDSKDIYQVSMKERKTYDSPSTVFMKKMGYEGVDVRHIQSMDNTTYGSVIYDLKKKPEAPPEKDEQAFLEQLEKKLAATRKAMSLNKGDSAKDFATKQQIIRYIKKAFDLPIYYGRFAGKRKLAIYKTKAQYVAAKISQAQRLSTITHELGHHLDKLLKLVNDMFQHELLNVPYVQQLRARERNADTQKLMKEGVAEFIRYYLMDPDEAVKLTPGFLNYFEDQLVKHGEIQYALLNTRAMIRQYMSTDGVKSHIATFVGEEAKRNQFALSNIKEWVVDDQAQIERVVNAITQGAQVSPDRNPYWKFRLAKGYQGKAYLFTNYGQYEWDRDNKLVEVGPSLRAIQDRIKKMGEGHLEDFTFYMIAKHAIEIETKKEVEGEDGQLIVVREPRQSGLLDPDKGIELEHLEAWIKGIEEGQHGKAYMDAQREVTNFTRFILKQLIGGSLSRKQYAKILEVYDHYIPWYRVMDDKNPQPRPGGNKYASIPKGVYRQKGGDLPIVNPWLSIVRQVHAFTALAGRNEAMLTLVRMLHDFEGTGKFFRKLDYTPQDVTRVSMMDLIHRLAELGVDINMPEQEITQIYLSMFRPQFKGNVSKNLLTTWEDGKAVFYEFYDLKLMNAIMQLDTDMATKFGQIGRSMANIMRIGHTVNFRFPFYNLSRDQFMAGVYSKSGYVPYLDALKGIFTHLGQGEMYKEFLMSGSAMSTFDSFDTDYIQRSIRGVMRKETATLLKQGINPLTHLRRLASLSEYGTNLGEYMAARRKGKHWIEAAMAGRDITVDWSRHGSRTREVRDWIPFINGFFQGNEKLIREVKNNPWRTLMRMFMFITLPTIGLYMINRENPNYHELSDMRKDLFWNIPFPIWDRNTKYFTPIPKPFIPGLIFGSLPERFMRWMETEDKTAFEGWASHMKQAVTPNTSIWLLELPNELKANHNFFTDRPIVPVREQYLPKPQQYGPYTSETAKLIGKIADVSPRKVDHTVNKVTGLLGRTAVSGMDAVLRGAGVADKTVRPEADITDLPILGDFFTKTTAAGSNTMSRFYNDKEKVETWARTEGVVIKDGKIHDPGPLTYQQAVLVEALPTFRAIERDLAEYRDLLREVQKSTDPRYTPEIKRIMIENIELDMLNRVRIEYGLPPITW